MSVAKTLSNLKRRLEKAELEHLRNHATDLANRLDKMEERAIYGEEQAEWYWEQHNSLIRSLTDQGEEIGMTADGVVGLITKPDQPTVSIGHLWPGTHAIYAGISLSMDHTQAVHLLLWPETDSTCLDWESAIDAARAISPEHSHLPTRIQYITLFKNLKSHFDTSPWYWTSEKTESGKSAFIQGFVNGSQSGTSLSAECRVRAVSEIPL